MFIQTEATPNPDTLKFLPGQTVVDSGMYEFDSVETATPSPLATALFSIQGVSRVFLGSDFISITKTPVADWKHVKPMSLATIMDHFTSGLPVMATDVATSSGEDIVYEGDAAEIVEEIKELIETRVRPAVAQDGGDITFERFYPKLVWSRYICAVHVPDARHQR